MNNKIALHYFLILTVIILSVSSCTSSPLPPVNVTRDGIAIKGYDPVAYFTDAMPVKGDSRFEYVWSGAKWLFASEEHLALFKNEPEKYAPRYGGYCAYAVSQGTTADIDPASWSIVDGKLYLNLNKDVQGLWEQDIPGYIQKADKNWPAVLNKK
jgi:YHS domain-containing protein